MRTLKKTLLVLIILLIHFSGKAQISFSCYFREYCTWNEYTEEFGDCEGFEESSLFVMNENETMITHTTENGKSTYYVNDKRYDSKNEVWFYYVTSDVGNKYLYVFDPDNNEIRVVVLSDLKTLIVFYTKAIF